MEHPVLLAATSTCPGDGWVHRAEPMSSDEQQLPAQGGALSSGLPEFSLVSLLSVAVYKSVIYKSFQELE